MDYTTRFLKRKGQPCEITTRTPSVVSKCIIAPASRSGFRVADRDNYIDGLILADTNLIPGEVVAVSAFISGNAGQKEILVFGVDPDPVSGQLKFMGAKSNTPLNWQRQTTSVDENYNVVTVWETVSADIPAFGQVVTAYLRQEDPGLLPTTRYLFSVPSTYGIQQMDRVTFATTVSCQVDSLDNIILDGIVRLQCSDDTRV